MPETNGGLQERGLHLAQPLGLCTDPVLTDLAGTCDECSGSAVLTCQNKQAGRRTAPSLFCGAKHWRLTAPEGRVTVSPSNLIFQHAVVSEVAPAAPVRASRADMTMTLSLPLLVVARVRQTYFLSDDRRQNERAMSVRL